MRGSFSDIRTLAIEAFTLPAGTRLTATGYEDVFGPNGEPALEVIALNLSGLPAGEALDSEPNLLPDSWELVFFGQTGQDPLADSDADGYSNLQELLLGTDPNDGFNAPGVPAVNLGAPILEAEIEDGMLKIVWQYPPPYDAELAFEVSFTPSLDVPWVVLDLPITPLGNGTYQVLVPADGATGFYWVTLVNP